MADLIEGAVLTIGSGSDGPPAGPPPRDPIEAAIVESVCGLLRRRAALAAERGRDRMTTIDHHGRDVVVSTPGSVIEARNERIWSDLANELEAELAGR